MAYEFIERFGGLAEEDQYRPYNASVRGVASETTTWNLSFIFTFKFRIFNEILIEEDPRQFVKLFCML